MEEDEIEQQIVIDNIKIEDLCECGNSKDVDDEYCSSCQETPKDKCKICHYYLDPSLCIACSKLNKKTKETRVVTIIRDRVIVPEHLVYNFRQRKPIHPESEQPEEDIADQCDPE